MSHSRGSRHQKLKHHVKRSVKQLHRMAAVAATMTAAATSGHARADSLSTPPRPPRTTMPTLPNVSLPDAGSNAVVITVSPPLLPEVPQAAKPVQAAHKTANKTANKTAVKSGVKAVAVKATIKRASTPQISTASIAVPSAIAHSSKAGAARPVAKIFMATLATRPETKLEIKGVQPVIAQVSTPVAVKTPVAVSTPVIAKTNQSDDRVLLAQLDEELKKTEAKLKSTDDKLSDGQRELLGLSNTLRNVIIEDSEGAAGLHPFVRVASRYAGTPYVWGGESRYGFDCSGFIIRVMRDLGYKALPHSAAEQFKYGQPIAQSLLKPGDIVFFANTYKPGISHVGIYIGKRRFIHAANTRVGTIISSLDASPYRQKYAGARRLISASKRA